MGVAVSMLLQGCHHTAEDIPRTRPRAVLTVSAGLGSSPGLLHWPMVWGGLDKGDPRTKTEKPSYPPPRRH